MSDVAAIHNLVQNVSIKMKQKIIVGQDEISDQILICVTSGTCITSRSTGLAKTLLVNTLAKALNPDFKRIQFTQI
jgi:MoxR-like ATPase